jgi:lipopolysaccharide biosynthesis glycosyltransferase
MIVFTSITLNYLPKARILANTLKMHHPDWEFHLVVSDRISTLNNSTDLIDFSNEPFDKVVWIDELKIPDFYNWVFKYTVVEVCTAIKGLYLQKLEKQGEKEVIYLDPDIAVFNSLSPLVRILDENAIALTPHLLDYPETEGSIRDNEIMGVLKHGVFNLGFFGVDLGKSDGRRFGKWWGHRLLNYCYADYGQNLFTDQKWCDLVPAYFKDVAIIHDPGYNVASWNLDKRIVSMSDKGQIVINKKYPLRFYHFTGYDSGAGDAMTARYGEGNQIVKEIWNWYGHKLEDYNQDRLGKINSFYNYYDNGQDVTTAARRIYRDRKDLQEAFPNPYQTEGITGKFAGGFYTWLRNNPV